MSEHESHMCDIIVCSLAARHTHLPSLPQCSLTRCQ